MTPPRERSFDLATGLRYHALEWGGDDRDRDHTVVLLHGFLDLSRSNTRPNVGDVVRIVPNHVCVVVNMMDEVVMVRGEEIIGTLPVAARGKLR